ncbi:unnamed protein product [Fusarium equiseti]|uniref:Uncharacterized protein n=1 Tax=Fusarium equiseti TaxID=61235 RepID=A0A8J2J2V6_FUSEQ|nr:unnamed protein product [Fusarium equiseti]
MCRYMELEYSCSTEGTPHRLRTTGLIQCNDYIGCMIEELNLKKPGREIQHVNLETVQYTLFKIGGDCEECATKKTELIQNEERVFRELEEELQEEERDFQGILEEIQNEDRIYREILEGIQKKKERSFRERRKEANNNDQSLSRWICNKLIQSPDEILGLRLYARGAAVQRPETVCSSGPCTGPVVCQRVVLSYGCRNTSKQQSVFDLLFCAYLWQIWVWPQNHKSHEQLLYDASDTDVYGLCWYAVACYARRLSALVAGPVKYDES